MATLPSASSASWLLFLFFTLHTLLLASAQPHPIGPETQSGIPRRIGNLTSLGNGSYPRAIVLHDKSILASYANPSHGNQTIEIVRSTDNGFTWKATGSVVTRPFNTSDLNNGDLLQLPSGRILCAFRNHDRNGTDYIRYRIVLSSSDDGGYTWSYLSKIDRPGPTYHGLWEPFLRLATNGSVQMYYSRENAKASQVNMMQPSHDGGKTWGKEMFVYGAKNVRDGMIGVTSLGGSRLLAVFEAIPCANPVIPAIYSMTSNDDGFTWTGRRRVYQAQCKGVCGAGAPQVLNVGGTLVATFMTDEDDPGKSWPNGSGIKTITSIDNGTTWSNKITITSPHSLWPGLLGLGNDTFLNFATADGVQAQRIILSQQRGTASGLV